MLIPRYIYLRLQKSLKPGTAILLMGARRVGKTTLVKKIADEFSGNTKFFNCDDPQVRNQFTDITAEQLKMMFQNTELIIFDEAQRIKNIGLTLKLITDELPTKRLLVSGSSSLDLANQINEPLTGRKKTFHLHPLSLLELYQYLQQDQIKLTTYTDHYLRFGSYPSLFDIDNEQEKEEYLLELAQDYLYKDALEYQDIRNSESIRKLLTALALQIGHEVSYTELANTVGIDQKTIIRYLDLLEKSYIIFRLPALSRNIRSEINKSRKIYFFDLGIRNALIRNFNSYELRSDLGQAWENLLIAERLKRNLYMQESKNYYFWRTYDQKEIDFIEEAKGQLNAFEFKWAQDKIIKPELFLKNYPNSTMVLINKKNMVEFVT